MLVAVCVCAIVGAAVCTDTFKNLVKTSRAVQVFLWNEQDIRSECVHECGG